MKVSENLISIEGLKEHLDDEKLVVADCRFNLGDPLAGEKSYQEGHVPGAIHFDLKKDLSGVIGEHGGRHPLPPLEEFVQKLSRAGVDETKHVVAYDDQGGSMAARLWWMLQYLGHENVSVLQGGYSEWVKQGHPTTKDIPAPKQTVFVPHPRPDMVVDIEGVKEKKNNADTVLIDARAPERYRGDAEPMDKKAGHIPGAENWFWKENVNENGKWKTAEQLKNRFAALKDKDEIIAYCGSGVSASANVLALKEAGIDKVKLYTGSWSDWSSYDENPVETGGK
jgi:thiosulfate/3-mercaptopyruvate sulfurtransferase